MCIESLLISIQDEYDEVVADRRFWQDHSDGLEKDIESLEDDLAKAHDTIDELRARISDLEDELAEYDLPETENYN